MSIRRNERSRLPSLGAVLLALAGTIGWVPPAIASVEDIQAKYTASAEAAREGDTEKAAKLSAEALALAEQELGKDNPQTGILAYNTGALYVALRSWAEARGPLEQALASYGKVHGEESPKLLPVMDQLRDVYQGLAEIDPAAALLERKLEIVKKEKGEDTREAADAMREYASANVVRGKHKLARRLLRRSIRIYEESVGEEVAEVGQAWIAMGFNELQDPETGVSKMDLAPKYILKGVGILEKVYPPGSREIIGLYDFMAGANRGIGLEKEAEEWEAKAKTQREIAGKKEAAGSE